LQHILVGDIFKVQIVVLHDGGVDPRIISRGKIQVIDAQRRAEIFDAIAGWILAIARAAPDVEHRDAAFHLAAAMRQHRLLGADAVGLFQQHGVGDHHHGGFLLLN
jgi:hypothetical protein